MRFVRDAVVTLAILVVLVVVVGYASLGNAFSATAAPGRLESSMALEIRNLSIPSDARQLRNPLAADMGAWREGADHFADHCAVCHGEDGRGGGEIGPHLYPRVPDMTQPRTRNLTDGEIFYIISNGVRWTGMPAWKGEHTPEETWRLVSFIRHLPSLTPAEIDQIEQAGEREHHHHGRDNDAVSSQ
jgi:mono/diheme cytochrome c family protein